MASPMNALSQRRMSWMLSGQALMFDSGEIAKAMREVGFPSMESPVVQMPMKLDVAIK